MKLLAFSVPGNKIQTPQEISPLMNALKPFGSNVWANTIELLLVVAILMTFVYFFYGGYIWMTSQGDKKKLQEARETIAWSVMGLILVFLSFLIVNVFGAFLQAPLLNNTLP